MIKRIPAILLGFSLLLAACTASAPGDQDTSQKKTDSIVTVFKPPT